MATTDRFGEAEHRDGVQRRPVDVGWLASPATWFAIAVAGMVVVFAGLIVDAYRHNNGAEEESLLSLSNPGHLVAGIGLLVTSLAALGGLSVSMLRGVDTVDTALRRFVPVTAAWLVVAGVGIGAVTYIGSTGVTVGHNHDDGTTAAAADTHDAAHDATDGGDAGVATALQDEGLLPDGTDPDEVKGALTQGASGHPDGRHDHGKHATFTQLREMSDDELLAMFPEGTVGSDDLPALKQQVMQVRNIAEQLDTPEKAAAAGFSQTTNDVPFMGEHWLNFDYVRDGQFDPAKPEGLLFSTIDGEEKKLVGVWFLQVPGIGGVRRDVEPVGFAGDLDLWHAHIGLCIVKLEGASEGETRESCQEKGGNFTPDLRWMMHVWVTPETSENSDGFFAYLNGDLYAKQTAAQGGGDEPSGRTQ
jgi:hypothetical protein